MKECCGDTVKSIRNVFEWLSLKDNQVKTFDAITDKAVDDIFTEIQLDNDLNKKETAVTLKNKPLIKGFLDYCCKQCIYYFSAKKYRNSEFATCQPVRLPPDVFERLHHLPNPIPDEATLKSFKQYMVTKLLTSSYHQNNQKQTKGMVSTSSHINNMLVIQT